MVGKFFILVHGVTDLDEEEGRGRGRGGIVAKATDCQLNPAMMMMIIMRQTYFIKQNVTAGFKILITIET